MTDLTSPSPENNTEPIIPGLEARIGPLMSLLGAVELLIWAGLIHRVQQEQAPVLSIEMKLMEYGLLLTWPFFLAEVLLSWFRRSSTISRKTVIWRSLLVLIFPPFRMAWIHPVTNRVWLPRLGWVSPSRRVAKDLDRYFNMPMFIIALAILPVLIVQNYFPDHLNDHPLIALSLHIGAALIWVAFACEFIVKISLAPRSLVYLKERWLDLLIVILPTAEFLLTHWVDASPLLRLLKIGRALGPQQIAQLTKIYRFRGVLMRGWHAFLLLEGVARIMGQTPEKKLHRIQERIADLQAQLHELHEEAHQLHQEIKAKEISVAENPLPSETASS